MNSRELCVNRTRLLLGLLAVLMLAAVPSGFAQTTTTLQSKSSPVAAQMRSLNNSLLNLHGQVQQAHANTLLALRGKAAKVIAQRATVLANLIQNNPHDALTFAFSQELLADLTAKFPESASHLEAHVSATGSLQQWIADGPAFKTSYSVWQLNTGGDRVLNLYFNGKVPRLHANQELQVTGVVLGSAMAVEDSIAVQSGSAMRSPDSKPQESGTVSGQMFLPLFGLLPGIPRSGRRASTRSPLLIKYLGVYGVIFAFLAWSVSGYSSNSCSTTGVQNTAVLLVNFSDIATTADSASTYADFFDSSTGRSLNGYWQEASYGQTSASGNVFGPFTVGASTSYSCSTIFKQLPNDVVAAAVAGGVNLQNYTRIFAIMPNLSCGWAGLTLMGSAGAGCSNLSTPAGPITASLSLLVDNYISTARYPFNTARDTAVALAAHEGGHQLGLAHSGTITDRPTAVLEPPDQLGQITDGADLFTVMGSNNLGLYKAQQRAAILGWMTSPLNYQDVSSNGTYTIQPIETSSSTTPQALRIQRGTTSGYYLWLEYKQPIGQYDSTLANSPYADAQPYTGAMITYEDPAYETAGQIPGHTYLADFNLADTYYLTPDLNPGQTWTDAFTNVSLSVVSANSSGLTVNVNYGSTPCTPSSPTVTVGPLNPSVYPGGSASYSVSVTNKDSSGCAANTFILGSGEPSNWPTSFSANSVTLNPGQSASISMSKTAPAGTPPGTYAVNSSASNTSDSGIGTANVTVVTTPSLTATTSVSSSTYSIKKGSVPITATVLYGGRAVQGASVIFTLVTPTGSKATQSATTGLNGTAVWNYKFSPKAATGLYSANAAAGYTPSGSSTQSTISNVVTFTVQ